MFLRCIERVAAERIFGIFFYIRTKSTRNSLLVLNITNQKNYRHNALCIWFNAVCRLYIAVRLGLFSFWTPPPLSQNTKHILSIIVFSFIIFYCLALQTEQKNACFSSSFFFYFCVSSLAVLLALAAQFALFILCSIRISSIFREFFYVLPLNGCFDAGSMHK